MFPQCESFFVNTHMVILLQIFISYIYKINVFELIWLHDQITNYNAFILNK